MTKWFAIAFALLLVAGRADAAAPTLRAVGSLGVNTGDSNPGVPTGTDTGDLLIMFIESRSEEAATASGWTQFQEEHSTATTTDGSRLTILYKIAESATPAMTVTDPGDHHMVRAVAVTVGTFDATTPLRLIVNEVRDSASASVSVSSGNTPVDDCLVFVAITAHPDGANSTAACDSPANATLTGFTEKSDHRRDVGDGGVFCVYSGTLATAGAIGVTTLTTNVSGDIVGVGGEIAIATCATTTGSQVMLVQ